MMRKQTWWMGGALLASTAWTCVAGTMKFDFKDPKGVNTVLFTLDAPLESISGSANGITGAIEFDPDRPAATKGRIEVASKTMHVPNPTMKDHMHGKDWMDVANHPSLAFEVDSLSNVRKEGDVVLADAEGKLTIKGATRNVRVPVKITHLKDKLAARTNNAMKGDLLVVRASFTVKRTDFGINPGAPTDKVSDEIALSLSIAGAAPKS